MKDYRYQTGFGNEFASEAEPGTLPKGQNNPQRPPRGLYAEQLSGSAFTALPGENLRSWQYRILPSVVQSSFTRIDAGQWVSDFPQELLNPNPLRWGALPWPAEETDFVSGMHTVCGNGEVEGRSGSAVHIYLASKPMPGCFYNADGELLIVPQSGALDIQTEFGFLFIEPGEIAVIPRGVKMRITPHKKAYGYVCENYGQPFRLPYRGTIGANGLANPRDFCYPVAAYENIRTPMPVFAKFGGQMFQAELDHSPFDVVAWHGNYVPYKYDLKTFNTINTVSFDHPDPSIFTVLTSPSSKPGEANVDFVIFPPRWMVAESTFRPPYYHRNIMSEYMGLIYGVYDAKPSSGGFVPGGGSLHNCMSGHGPEREAFDSATKQTLKPTYLTHTLAFMFESSLIYRPTRQAMASSALQPDYLQCWQDLESHFK